MEATSTILDPLHGIPVLATEPKSAMSERPRLPLF